MWVCLLRRHAPPALALRGYGMGGDWGRCGREVRGSAPSHSSGRLSAAAMGVRGPPLCC